MMEVLVINQQEVRSLMPMGECIEWMAEALATLAKGNALQPLRSIMWLPDRMGALGLMPAYLRESHIMGVKAVSVFPGNQATEFETHQGVVMIFETEHGRLIALVDAGEVTAIRTAATSAVATLLLARPDSRRLAILGAGTQARAHLEAMLQVRPIESVRVWSLPQNQAHGFAEREAKNFGIPIEPVASAREAVTDADIICTVTAAPEPILFGDFLPEGAHINAVGSSSRATRELDTAAVVRSRLFVDRRESTLNEAGDFLFPKAEGAIGDEHILGEIGEVLVGSAQGRTSSREITLFKSVGLAVQDVASAGNIYRKAVERGLGSRVVIGGKRLTEMGTRE